MIKIEVWPLQTKHLLEITSNRFATKALIFLFCKVTLV